MKRLVNIFKKKVHDVTKNVVNLNIEWEISETFKKIGCGSVAREDGAFLLRDFVRRDKDKTIKTLLRIVKHPPNGVFTRTILHTVSLTKNPIFIEVFEKAFEQGDEQTVIAAAEGLADISGVDTRAVLVKHLSSECYQVRKAASEVLLARFKTNGLDDLVKDALSRREHIYIITSANAMLKYPEEGVRGLLQLVSSKNSFAVNIAATFLLDHREVIQHEHMPGLIEGLRTVVNAHDGLGISAMLKLLKEIHIHSDEYDKQIFSIIKPVKKSLEQKLNLY